MLRDSINPCSGNRGFDRNPLVLGRSVAAIILALLCGQGCEKKPPAWAEESHPDYLALLQPYHLIAFELEKRTKAGTNLIVTFDALATAVRKSNPETRAEIEGENPFPGLLPQRHSYRWLSSWESVTNRGKLPVIWATLQLREPTLLYITANGEVRVEKPEVFRKLLDGHISQGAKLNQSGNIEKLVPD